MNPASFELPPHLKELYHHWSSHTVATHPSTLEAVDVFDTPELFGEIRDFVDERIRIWKKKTRGEFPPYTTDHLLSKYRFCNIFREFDRQTIAFHTLTKPLRDDFPLWLINMFYCRMVARTETVEKIGFLSYDSVCNRGLYERFMSLERPRFGTPYVFPVSTIMKGSTPTRELFITEHLPKVMRQVAGIIEGWKRKSVYDGVREILPVFGYNLSFLWTEVLIDVAYQYPEYINLFDTFPIGPGSLPTMKRIQS